MLSIRRAFGCSMCLDAAARLQAAAGQRLTEAAPDERILSWARHVVASTAPTAEAGDLAVHRRLLRVPGGINE